MYELQGKFENKVIAITGASGYIGSALVNELEKYSAKKHGGLGNIFYTDGKQGKVIKLIIKGRNGKQVQHSHVQVREDHSMPERNHRPTDHRKEEG